MSLYHLSWRAFQILLATVSTVLTQGESPGVIVVFPEAKVKVAADEFSGNPGGIPVSFTGELNTTENLEVSVPRLHFTDGRGAKINSKHPPQLLNNTLRSEIAPQTGVCVNFLRYLREREGIKLSLCMTIDY